MGFLKKVIKEEAPTMAVPGAERYIDLATYEGPRRPRAGMEVKVAELSAYEDIRDLSSFIYEGHILLLDFTSIANDELTLRRVITELKRLVQDVDGDLAGVNKNLLLVTPKSVRIDRRKIRRSF